MTTRPGARLRLGRWLRWIALGLGTVTFVVAGLIALYLSRPAGGPGHEVLDALGYPFRQSEALQYDAHRALGKLFSLCACTAGLSADQYRRAGYHRPRGSEDIDAP